jgi:hypothetical protein
MSNETVVSSVYTLHPNVGKSHLITLLKKDNKHITLKQSHSGKLQNRLASEFFFFAIFHFYLATLCCVRLVRSDQPMMASQCHRPRHLRPTPSPRPAPPGPPSRELPHHRLLQRLAVLLIHRLLAGAHPVCPDAFTFPPLVRAAPSPASAAQIHASAFRLGLLHPQCLHLWLPRARMPSVRPRRRGLQGVRRNAGAGCGRLEHDGLWACAAT